MRRSKRKTVHQHAKKRCRQRLGFTLTKEKELKILDLISQGRYKSSEKQSNRVFHYIMDIENTECKVIVDKKRNQIVTVWDNNYEDVWTRLRKEREK